MAHLPGDQAEMMAARGSRAGFAVITVPLPAASVNMPSVFGIH
jgi:hypothetical protein